MICFMWTTILFGWLWLIMRSLKEVYRKSYEKANQGWKEALDGWHISNNANREYLDTINAITREFYEETGRMPDRIVAEMAICEVSSPNPEPK